MLFKLAAAAAAEARAVQLVGGPIVHIVVPPPGPATPTLELQANGEEWHDKGGTFAKAGDWLLLGTASDYEVRATLQSGDTPSGTLNTWLTMNQLNDWGFVQNGSGLLLCNLLVEIRLVASGQVFASETYTLRAEVTN